MPTWVSLHHSETTLQTNRLYAYMSFIATFRNNITDLSIICLHEFHCNIQKQYYRLIDYMLTWVVSYNRLLWNKFFGKLNNDPCTSFIKVYIKMAVRVTLLIQVTTELQLGTLSTGFTLGTDYTRGVWYNVFPNEFIALKTKAVMWLSSFLG